MRWWAIVAAAGGAVMAGAVGWWLVEVRSAETGDPLLDGLLPRAAFELARRGLLATKHMRAFAAILHNEHSNGQPASRIRDPMQPGDLTVRKGPSVGPGQVLRDTAIDLGLWPSKGDRDEQLDDDDDRQAYLAFGTNPANQGELVGWAVAVYLSKLRIAACDVPRAVELYNGSGERAEQYQANAQSWHQLHFGEDLA